MNRLESIETTNVDLSAAALVIEDLIDLCQNELAAVTDPDAGDDKAPGKSDGQGEVERIADLHIRLALLFWSDPAHSNEVLAALDKSLSHPLTSQLLLAQAIRRGDRELLEKSHDSAKSTLEGPALLEAMRDIAEAWLYHLGEPTRAAQVLDPVISSAEDGGKGHELLDELRYLQLVALAQSGSWSEMASVLQAVATAKNSDLAVAAEAIHILIDRLDDKDGARSLLGQLTNRLAEPVADDGDAARRFRLVAAAVELQAAAQNPNDAEMVGLYRQLLALVQRSADTEREAAAVRFLLADHLRRVGDLTGAAEALAPITPPNGQGIDWGSRLATMVGAQLAVAAGDWPRSVESLRHLARTGGGSVSEGLGIPRRRAERCSRG